MSGCRVRHITNLIITNSPSQYRKMCLANTESIDNKVHQYKKPTVLSWTQAARIQEVAAIGPQRFFCVASAKMLS